MAVKKIILLTGGTGQVGKCLIELNWPVDLHLQRPERAELELSDGANVKEYLNNTNPDYIINCAAYTDVDKAESEPDLVEAINAKAPAILAQYAYEHDIPVIQISTDYVFDGQSSAPYVESDDVNPMNVYGRTKLAGEQAIADSGARAVILRTAWIFSANDNNFLKTMLRIGLENDVVRVVDDQIGSPTSAASLAKIIQNIALCFHRKNGVPNGIYHCVNQGTVSWYGLASYIFEVAESYGYRSPKLVPVSTQEFPTVCRRPANSRLCTRKLERQLGICVGTWQNEVDDIIETLLGSEA